MALINTGSIANELRPGLAALTGAYARYPSQYKEVFNIYTSDKYEEIEVEMRFTGLAQIKPEGGPIAVDTMGQRIITTYVHRNVGISFIITQEALQDNLYKTRFPMQSKALLDSMEQAKETLGMAVLNNGFDVNFPLGDGQPLFSTAHPIDGGTFSNKPSVATDLNEASLEAACITIEQFKNQAGLIVMTKPRKLIVPPQNQFVAQRILGSAFRTGTANNDESALYSMSMIPEGARVNQFLTLPNSFFVVTDAPDGLKMYERTPLETDVYCDFLTKNLMASANQRYSFGVTNVRSIYGSSGM
jgi:phage major head subunit gpT-like protein